LMFKMIIMMMMITRSKDSVNLSTNWRVYVLKFWADKKGVKSVYW